MRYAIVVISLLLLNFKCFADIVEIYNLKYRDKNEVIETLKQFKNPKTVIQGFQNQIILNGDKQDIEKLKQLIEKIDIKQNQFIIKVAVGVLAKTNQNTISTMRASNSNISSIRFLEGNYISIAKQKTKAVVTSIGYIKDLDNNTESGVINNSLITKTNGVLLTANLLSDDMVNIKIKSSHEGQFVDTIIETKLGQWTNIFQSNTNKYNKDIFYSTDNIENNDLSIWIELVD